MGFLDAIDEVARNAEKNISMDNTYEKDGLLFCAKCNTARQKKIELFGITKVVPILCKCMNEDYVREEEERKREERMRQIMSYRNDGFPDREMRHHTFDADDGKNPELTDAMKAYVKNFHTFREDGKGLLLYGNVGTGKSFYAACIVNALIDRGYPCMMTNFSRLTNTISGMWEGKQAYIDGLSRYALVAIDDLGVERDTDYMNECVTTIIDSLYRANVPMIITSNHTPKQLLGGEDIRRSRIYDRVLERCHPIKVDGESRRREKGREEFREVNRILGIQ